MTTTDIAAPAPAAPPEPPRATWREWLGLAAVALPVFMIATDMTVLFLALPAIAADLTPSGTQLLWMLHVGDFLAAGFVLTMGRVADRIGGRRLMLAGVAVYGVGSTVAAFAGSAETLIVVRAVLGIAAATVAPAAISLLRRMFPDGRQFGVAFAVFMAAFSGGMALGAPLGGVLLEHFWWGSVFLANVPAAPFLLPGARGDAAGRVDALSVALSVAGVMALVYGFQELADQGVRPLLVVSGLAGAVLLTLFVRRQRRLADPLLDLRLFDSRAVRVAAPTLLALVLSFAATDLFLVQHLQVVAGLSPVHTAGLMMIVALASIGGTLVAPVLSRLFRPGPAIALSLAVGAVGATVAGLALAPGALAFVVVGGSLIAVGGSMAITVTGQLLVTSAPEEQAGSAAGVQDIGAGLGNALGLALVGSLGTVVYGALVHRDAPAALQAADVAAARESIGGAETVAGELSGSAGDTLMDTAGTAWLTATQSVYGVGVLLAGTTAVLVLWRLRGVRMP